MQDPPALYLDEDVDVSVAARLRVSGFDVLTTRDAGNLGRRDEEQLDFAARSDRVFVTHNIQDFMRLAQRWASEGRSHAGIIYVSFEPPGTLCAWLEDFFRLYPRREDTQNCTFCLPVSSAG